MEDESYAGTERRIHRLYVTRNTEYHFRGDRCVAVRDRKTETWLPAHLAIDRRLSGGVRLLASGCAVPTESPPVVGESLYFGDDGRELVTSAVCDIRRPQPEIVELYPP
ncbi:MAG TPA: hypothetical protein VKY73_18255 [Polyangiaceae bacterium]|nr:hypothetical protein [Polyangiaceae bacterium]